MSTYWVCFHHSYIDPRSEGRQNSPRCDLCEVAKVPGLCPSKRKVTVKSPTKRKEKDAALAKIELDAGVLLAPASSKDEDRKEQVIQGELLVEPAGDGTTSLEVTEVRHIKTEDSDIDQTATTITAPVSLQW